MVGYAKVRVESVFYEMEKLAMYLVHDLVPPPSQPRLTKGLGWRAAAAPPSRPCWGNHGLLKRG